MDKKTPRHRLHAKANEKKAGEWNSYDIVFDGSKVVLKVNGEVINEGTGAEVVAGKICLQSEGTPMHFRRIRLTEIRHRDTPSAARR